MAETPKEIITETPEEIIAQTSEEIIAETPEEITAETSEIMTETSEETFYEPWVNNNKRRRGQRGGEKRGAEIAISFKRIKLLQDIIAVSFCAIIITNIRIYDKHKLAN